MMGFRKKGIILWAVTLFVLFGLVWTFALHSEAAGSVSGTWKQDSKGWWFRLGNGGYAKDEYINGYYLDKKGYWQKKWNGSWKKDKTGWWFKAGKWYPKKQWLRVDRKYYYFNAKGYLVTNAWVGNYYVNKDGVWTKTRSGVTPKTTTLSRPTYPNGSAVKKSGALQVIGTDLCDASGKKIQLKGVSTFGIIWDEGRYNINQDAFKTVKGWGANVIRLAVYTEEYGGYCRNDVARSELDKIIADGVSYATNLGMYVIIDWHILNDGNPKTHLAEAKQFFADYSNKYANYDNVLYEICNEPNGGTSWADVKSYADTIIPVIRGNDSDAIILVGTPTWSQDVDQVASNPVKQKKNVMYVMHFYAATHKEWLRDKLKSARAAGTPVFITECSSCSADGNGSIDYSSANEWKKLINDNKISFVGWSLSNKNETSAIIRSSCSKHSGWSDSELTDSGRYLKQWIQGK